MFIVSLASGEEKKEKEKSKEIRQKSKKKQQIYNLSFFLSFFEFNKFLQWYLACCMNNNLS